MSEDVDVGEVGLVFEVDGFTEVGEVDVVGHIGEVDEVA